MAPFDCGAHHAVTYVMEMQGRTEDGIGWMNIRKPFCSAEDNFFSVHNWWHLALKPHGLLNHNFLARAQSKS